MGTVDAVLHRKGHQAKRGSVLSNITSAQNLNVVE
jgi:hypothetical protein